MSRPAGQLCAADDPDASISACRTEIDRLDAGLRTALADRRRHSARVQSIRLDAAGDRLDPRRERELIRCWVEELGPEAEPIVRAVLQFCRGGGVADRQPEPPAVP